MAKNKSKRQTAELGNGLAKWFDLMLDDNTEVDADLKHIIRVRHEGHSIPNYRTFNGTVIKVSVWIKCTRCDAVWKIESGELLGSYNRHKRYWVIKCPCCGKQLQATPEEGELSSDEWFAEYEPEPLDEQTYNKLDAFNKHTIVPRKRATYNCTHRKYQSR